MADTARYYALVRDKHAELAGQFPTGFCLVMSVFNLDKNSTPGAVAEVTTAVAAKLLVNGTHRLTTEDEATAFRKADSEARLASARMVLQANALHAQITDVVRAQGTLSALMEPKPEAKK